MYLNPHIPCLALDITVTSTTVKFENGIVKNVSRFIHTESKLTRKRKRSKKNSQI